MEPGRAVKVPSAEKPNNLYYVEILLPYERELHIEFMDAFVRKFPSSKFIQMPGLKPFGTDRRLRLFFNTTTAPREVFTDDDPNIPIREIVLPCGTASQIIHKWQKLNQHRPPHLANRWHTPTPARSYAAAATSNVNGRALPPYPVRRPGEVPAGPPAHNTTTPNPATNHKHRDGNADWTSNAPLDTTNPPSIPVHPHRAPTHATRRSSLTVTPGERPRAQPRNIDAMDTTSLPSVTNPTNPRQNNTTLTNTNPVTPPLTVNQESPLVDRITTASPNPTSVPDTNRINPDVTMATISSATTTPNPGSATRLAQNTQDRAGQSTETPTNNSTPHHMVPAMIPPSTTIGAGDTEEQQTDTITLNTTDQSAHTPPGHKPTKPTHPHPTPSRSSEEIAQWQHVKRSRRPRNNTSSSNTNNSNTITRSASQTGKQKNTNMFAPLEYEIHPTYEDDNISPITVKIPTKQRKPSRRKYRVTQKAWTKQVINASAQPQELRHPMHTLQHLSPKQTQVVLRSNDEKAKPIREKLLNQIALLRAARTNTTQSQTLLDKHDDGEFLQQVQTRISECDDPPPCTALTPTDIPLRTLLDRDEMRVRGALCFAWMDLVTRAALPDIYDCWPEQPSWLGTPLVWLPASDAETPCLHDGALAALAACPSLQNVWAQVSKDTPELGSAIRTAANQWRIYMSKQQSNRTESARNTTTKQ